MNLSIFCIAEILAIIETLCASYVFHKGSISTKLRIPLLAKDPDNGMNGTVTFKLKNDYDGQFKVEDGHWNNVRITSYIS